MSLSILNMVPATEEQRIPQMSYLCRYLAVTTRALGAYVACSDEVSQKACGVVIPFVQRKPGGRLRAAGEPFAQERGLTKACGGGDEAQSAVQTLIQALDQAGAQDNFRLGWGDIEFSG